MKVREVLQQLVRDVTDAKDPERIEHLIYDAENAILYQCDDCIYEDDDEFEDEDEDEDDEFEYAPRKAPMTVNQMMACIDALPEEQRAAVLKQLEKL